MLKLSICIAVSIVRTHDGRYIGPKQRGKFQEPIACGARGWFTDEPRWFFDPPQTRWRHSLDANAADE